MDIGDRNLTATLIIQGHGKFMTQNNNSAKFFVVSAPTANALYKVEKGVCTELICGFTDLRHTIGVYHDSHIGEEAKEFCNYEGTYWGILTDIDPSIEGEYYLNSNILKKIYSDYRNNIPKYLRTVDDVYNHLHLYLGQWHSVLFTGEHSSTPEECCEWLRLSVERQQKLRNYLVKEGEFKIKYHYKDKSMKYKVKLDLYMYDKWISKGCILKDMPKLMYVGM